MSAAGMATSMAWFRVHPARQSKPPTPAMTITQATPTRRSVKPFWPIRSIRSQQSLLVAQRHHYYLR